MSHNWELNISSKLEWNKVNFICHSADNQNLLISSFLVPALIENTLCRNVPVLREVFLNKNSQFEISYKGKKYE